jgi:PPOX class probable F420-dependent enzyme
MEPRSENPGDLSAAEAFHTPAAAPPTFEFDETARHNFLMAQRDAVLATVNRDGSPQATPTWYHWDGGLMRISSPAWTQKVRNIRRDPRVSVCVDDQVSGTFVTLFGTAEIVAGDRVPEETWPVLLKYLHEDEARSRWARINADGDRVVIVVRPHRMVWRTSVR